MAEVKGRVSQILGGVVDVTFPEDQMPEIYDAVHILRPDQDPVTLEVQTHLGEGQIRGVAMDATEGLESIQPTLASVTSRQFGSHDPPCQVRQYSDPLTARTKSSMRSGPRAMADGASFATMRPDSSWPRR